MSGSQKVLLGRISGLFGVRGWVKVYSYTEPRDHVGHYDPWYLKREGRWQLIHPTAVRLQGKTLIAKLDGVNTREQAARFVGAELAVNREQLPDLAADEYYWAELIGLSVRNLKGQNLGVVDRLMETGAHDVLIVRGDRERLIPFAVGPIVKTVDLDQGEVVVDWDLDY